MITIDKYLIFNHLKSKKNFHSLFITLYYIIFLKSFQKIFRLIYFYYFII